jgi:hypothetical protein
MDMELHFKDPVTLTVEASWDVIHELGLNEDQGEQYDRIMGAISIEDTMEGLRIVSVRTFEAYKRGAPNAGRGEWFFPPGQVERIWQDGKVIWGKRIPTAR